MPRAMQPPAAQTRYDCLLQRPLTWIMALRKQLYSPMALARPAPAPAMALQPDAASKCSGLPPLPRVSSMLAYIDVQFVIHASVLPCMPADQES